METNELLKEEKKSKISFMNEKYLSGVWSLVYTPTGALGAEGFGGHFLSSYTHPVSQLPCPIKDVSGKILAGYMMDSLEKRLFPDRDKNQRILIDWMLAHPDIALDNYEGLDEKIVIAKNKNSKIKLVCLDRQKMDFLEKEDYIDKLVGLVSLDLGKRALSLNRLRHILSKIGLSYYDLRYVKNRTVEKKSLRSRLKTFIRKSIENAKIVEAAINDPDGAKYSYLIKEMLRYNIITMNNGMYIYNGIPITSTYQGLLEWFHTNPELFAEAENALLKITQ